MSDTKLVCAENIRLGRVEAPLYDRNHFEIFHPWEQRRLALEAARHSKVQLILDVAVGTGNFITKFPLSCTRVGVDLSAEMLAQAAGKAPALHLVRALADALPFGDGTFDLVLTYSSLHHFSDSLAAVREMGRTVKPGGTLILDHEECFQERGWRRLLYSLVRYILSVVASVHYWRRPEAQGWLAYRKVYWPFSGRFGDIDFHLTDGNPVDPDAIERTLRARGFSVRRRHYFHHPLPMVSTWQTLADCLCRKLRMGHYFIEAERRPATPRQLTVGLRCPGACRRGNET